MNMFSESSRENQAKSIRECTQSDSVSSNLWTWAERIETLGKILFWILVVLGIVLSFISSVDEYEDFSFPLFLISIAKYGLYAFLEYCAYHIIALLIGALASIVQNTRATAKLAEYTARREFPETVERGSVGNNVIKPISNTKIGKCEMCNKDNTKITLAKFSDKTGTYRRKMCDHCIKEYNATIE